MEQFVFHDPAESLAHVVASDSTYEGGLLVRPSLSQKLPGDSDLKSPDTGAGMESRGGAATSAGHSL